MKDRGEEIKRDSGCSNSTGMTVQAGGGSFLYNKMPFSRTCVCKPYNKRVHGCWNEARFCFDPSSREPPTKQKEGQNRRSSESAEHAGTTRQFSPSLLNLPIRTERWM